MVSLNPELTAAYYSFIYTYYKQNSIPTTTKSQEQQPKSSQSQPSAQLRVYNIEKSEGSPVAVAGPLPEVSKVVVTVLLLDAVDDFPGVVGDHHDFGELDEVVLDDEHTLLRVGRLVVRREHPVVVARQRVAAPDHHVRVPIHRVPVPHDHVVELQDVTLHLAQQLRHQQHLLVQPREDARLLTPVLAGDVRLPRAVPSISVGSPEAEVPLLPVILLQEAVAAQTATPLAAPLAAPLVAAPLALEVLLEGGLEVVDGAVGVVDQLLVDLEHGEAVQVVPPHLYRHTQQHYYQYEVLFHQKLYFKYSFHGFPGIKNTKLFRKLPLFPTEIQFF